MALVEISIQNGEATRSVGRVDLTPEVDRSQPVTFITNYGEIGTIDLSAVTRRFRGPKNVEIVVPGIDPKEVALNRKTGIGYQTLAADSRIVVTYFDPNIFVKQTES